MKKILVVCLLIACAIYSRSQKIVFTTHWLPQSQFAGFYAASVLGFYAHEGLDVVINHPNANESAFVSLKDGKSNIVMLYLSEALFMRSKGFRLVNVMQLSQQSGLTFVSHRKLNSMTDLNKYRVGIWNYVNLELLDIICRRWKVDAKKIIRFNSGINPFLSGALDVQIMTTYNEFVSLRECGFQPKYIYRFQDWGYKVLEEGLYVTENFYKKNKPVVDKFVRATRRGWEWANTHRDKMLDIVTKRMKDSHVASNRYHQSRQLDEILRLQVNPVARKRTFTLSQSDFENALSIFQMKGKFQYHDFVK